MIRFCVYSRPWEGQQSPRFLWVPSFICVSGFGAWEGVVRDSPNPEIDRVFELGVRSLAVLVSV
jgi:hypothetical protein